MLAAVQFDDDLRFGTDEVADVGADHVLAPELESAHLTTAKTTPKEAFGGCQVLTQVSGKVEHGPRATYARGLNMTLHATIPCVAHDPSAPAGHLPGFAREERTFDFPPYAQAWGGARRAEGSEATRPT